MGWHTNEKISLEGNLSIKNGLHQGRLAGVLYDPPRIDIGKGGASGDEQIARCDKCIVVVQFLQLLDLMQILITATHPNNNYHITTKIV